MWLSEWIPALLAGWMDRRMDGWEASVGGGGSWKDEEMDGGIDTEKLERLPWGRESINHDWWQFLTISCPPPPP